MEKNQNVKKLYLVVGVTVLVAAAAVIAVIMVLSGRGTVQKSLKLGNQYLSDLEYDAAIQEYSNTLLIDPTNQEALLGLAKSYMGAGDAEIAYQIFENDLAETNDEDALRAYAQLLIEEERYPEAVDKISDIINLTDKDEDYQWRDEIIKKQFQKNYGYSESAGIEIQNNGGEVYTKGNNILGALGTDVNFGMTEATVDSLVKADYTGTVESVFTTGTCSAIIDDAGALWIAGSNRSGQKANQSTEFIADYRWKVSDSLTEVVKVAGNESTMFALTSDGTLWVSGYNKGYVKASTWLNTWTPISSYGQILDIQCNENYAAFVNEKGNLYIAYIDNYVEIETVENLWWQFAAGQVAGFTLCDNELVWNTYEGAVYSYYGYIYFPESWQNLEERNYEIVPPFSVASMSVVDDGLYLLSTDGTLTFVKDGNTREIELTESASHIYTSGENCVVQLENAGFLLYDNDGNRK